MDVTQAKLDAAALVLIADHEGRFEWSATGKSNEQIAAYLRAAADEIEFGDGGAHRECIRCDKPYPVGTGVGDPMCPDAATRGDRDDAWCSEDCREEAAEAWAMSQVDA